MPNTPSFSFSIEGQKRSEFLVLGFDIEEAISQPYLGTIDAVCENYGGTLDNLRNTAVYRSIGNQGFHQPADFDHTILTQWIERRSQP